MLVLFKLLLFPSSPSCLVVRAAAAGIGGLTRSCQNESVDLQVGSETLNCQEIRSRPEDFRENACKILDVYYACPQVCGVCCEDETDYRFDIQMGPQDRACDWISRTIKRQKYCINESNGRIIQDGCPYSCDFCFDHVKPATPATCENEVSFKYPSFVDTNSPLVNCREIRSIESRRQKMCQVKEVYDACPQTCGKCCHNDDTFLFQQNNINPQQVNCKWLVEDADKKYERLRTYCGELVNGRTVSDACPEYCHLCSPHIEALPTQTGGTFSDPHYLMWGGLAYYDFQGRCDNIAVDNDVLQLQYRTSNINSNWSGITQMALKWKQTNEIVFSLDVAAISDSSPHGFVLNNANSLFEGVISYRVEAVITGNNGGKYMYFTFLESSDDEKQKAFIRVEARLDNMTGLYAYDVQIRANDSIFKGSNGVLGSYDNIGIMQLRDGTQIDATSMSEEEILTVVKSWQLTPEESLFDDISDLCGYASPTVSPSDAPISSSPSTINIPEISGGFVQCPYTCEDIKHPTMKYFCEIDVELTGSKEWACSSTYLNPVFDINDRNAAVCPEGNCRVCPTSCKGDAVAADGRFPVTMKGTTRKHFCKWAVRRNRRRRCALHEVALNCCETCCQECAGDAAGSDFFKIPEKKKGKKRKRCDWAARKQTKKRCSFPTVARMCCETCSKA